MGDSREEADLRNHPSDSSRDTAGISISFVHARKVSDENPSCLPPISYGGLHAANTSDTPSDGDDDGLPDRIENQNRSNPYGAGENLVDLDQGGFSDTDEMTAGSNPDLGSDRPLATIS